MQTIYSFTFGCSSLSKLELSWSCKLVLKRNRTRSLTPKHKIMVSQHSFSNRIWRATVPLKISLEKECQQLQFLLMPYDFWRTIFWRHYSTEPREYWKKTYNMSWPCLLFGTKQRKNLCAKLPERYFTLCIFSYYDCIL